MRKTVLVTGHKGYIGPVLVRLLKDSGHRVIGLDTGYYTECLDGSSREIVPDKEIVADIRAIDRAAFEGVDAVCHLAALSNDPLGAIVAEQTHSINTEGTRRAAAMAKQAGVGRFVLASSCSLYGAAGGAQKPLDETAPLAPVSAYAVSKVEGEKAIFALKGPGFRPIALRNATAYGVSPRMRLDLVLGNLTAYGEATGVIRVMSDGTPWRPLVHIEDIARAMVAAVEAPDAGLKHDVYNIGQQSSNYQVKEIAAMVAGQLGRPCRVEITGESGGDPRSYRVDFSRALTDLPGFAPSWTLENGAAESARWTHDRKLDLAGFLSRLYIRLEQMKHLRASGRIDPGFFWQDRKA